MNIQKTNMLLLDNRIKMKEEGTAPVSAPVEQEGAEQKDVMKAMNMLGKTNYMNNVAFQGGMKNKAASLAMGALLVLGAASLASCQKDHFIEDHEPVVVNVETNVTVDMKAFAEMFTQMLNQMKEQQAIDEARWNQMYSYMQQLLNIASQGNLSQEQFFAKMFEYMTTISGNQELILNQLVKNGMSQDEANRLLQQLINDVKSGNISAQEAWNKIQALLGSIDNSLKSILSELSQARKDLDQIRNNSYINTKQNADIIAKLQTLINGQNNIAGKIDKNTATITEVAAQLGMSLNELYAMLKEMGISMTDAMNMNAADIIKAINRNTATLKGIQAQLQYIAMLVQQGNISEAYANKIMIDLLKNINANVADIKKSIGNYYGNNQAILDKLDRIIEQGDTQIAQNGQQTLILTQILGMLKNGVSKDQIQILIDYAAKNNADMSKLLRLVTALNQNVSDGRAENRQFANDVIETLNKLGMENADNFATVIDLMNSLDSGADDLRALIQKFMNAYKNGSKLTNAQLKAILDALGDLKLNGSSVDLTALENMMKELLNLVKGGNNLLTSIDAKLGLINVTQDAILDAIDRMHKDIPNYKPDLDEIKALLQSLNNKPGYDDTKVLNKLAEILEVIKTHEFCHCKCDPNSGHNEGIISDIKDIVG